MELLQCALNRYSVRGTVTVYMLGFCVIVHVQQYFV